MSIPHWNAVWKHTLSPTRKLVALSLADQANEAGECYPSVSMIVERTGLSERSVYVALSDLEASGLVTKSTRAGRSTLYKITDPCTWCTPAAPAPLQEAHTTPAPAAAPPLQHVQDTPAAPAPITTIEPPIESPPNQKDVAAPLTFADFWAEYPEKVAKPQCAAKWESKGCAEHAAEIVADVKARKTRDRKWLSGYVPNPLTYLNQERWRDPLPTSTAAKPSVAENFTGKTYQGTPVHELPEYLR